MAQILEIVFEEFGLNNRSRVQVISREYLNQAVER
jgi:hypothetical protein